MSNKILVKQSRGGKRKTLIYRKKNKISLQCFFFLRSNVFDVNVTLKKFFYCSSFGTSVYLDIPTYSCSKF